MGDIKDMIRNSRRQEVEDNLKESISKLNEDGYFVEFGKIGLHTTYALITDSNSNKETVGYTFIKDLKYYRESVGKLKALQQAIARQKLSEETKE